MNCACADNRVRGLFSILFSGVLMLLLAACGASVGSGVVTVEPTYATVEAFDSMLSTATPTVAPSATPVQARFAVIGDFGDSGPDEEAVADLVKSWGVDFVVTTGDNNYFSGKAETIDENIGQYYHSFIHPYDGEYGAGAGDINRFFPALGGHDWEQPNAQPHLDFFTLPGNERYYDVLWEPVHIFILDSNDKEPDGNTVTSVQGQWLQETMTASDAPWKIVVAHDPPFSSGRHGEHDHMKWPYAEWGASAVLSGDDHSYERLIVDDLPYFVNGLGGARIYDFDEDEILEESVVRFNETHGAMLVEATEESIRFRFITRDGETVDDFVLERESSE